MPPLTPGLTQKPEITKPALPPARGQAHVQMQSAGIAPPQLDEFHLQFDRAPSAGKFDK